MNQLQSIFTFVTVHWAHVTVPIANNVASAGPAPPYADAACALEEHRRRRRQGGQMGRMRPSRQKCGKSYQRLYASRSAAAGLPCGVKPLSDGPPATR
jgi:hypothetical protein